MVSTWAVPGMSEFVGTAKFFDKMLVFGVRVLIYNYSTDLKNEKHYCVCGNEKSKKSKICKSCSDVKQRKIKRPDKETLLKDIEELGYTGTGRKYGVSDNAIRKWIKKE